MTKLQKKYATYSWQKDAPIATAVRDTLDGSGYGVGELERVKDELSKVATMLACLVEKLEDKGAITTADVLGMLDGSWEVATDGE